MYIIGITGGSGSGKTTFAKKIIKNTTKKGVSIVHMDSYYVPKIPESLCGDKGHPNFDHPESFDWNLLASHLETLKNGDKIKCPIYDFKTHSRTTETYTVGPSKVIIFEGILAIYNAHIRDLLDIKCFLQVDADIRFIRRLHRDVKERKRSLESVIEQYYDTVRPMYKKYIDPQRDQADFIVGEETDVGAKIISAKIDKLLQ